MIGQRIGGFFGQSAHQKGKQFFAARVCGRYHGDPTFLLEFTISLDVLAPSPR